MKIINHRLCRDDGTPYPFRASPNVGGVLRPRWLVVHYTAGSSARESIEWLCARASLVSAHLVIAADMSITQLVPFNVIAWHAGKSVWNGVEGLNNCSIGIELDYPGPSEAWPHAGPGAAAGQWLRAAHANGGPVRYWPAFPPMQLIVARQVGALLVAEYGLEDALGHDQISPGRKQDPGPAFPMSEFRASVMSPLRTPPPAGSGAVARINVPGIPKPQH